MMTDYIYAKSTQHSELCIEYYGESETMVLFVDDGNHPSFPTIHLSPADFGDMVRAVYSAVGRDVIVVDREQGDTGG